MWVSKMGWSECGLVVSPGTQAYAVPTRSLREAYACPRAPLAGIRRNIRLKQEPVRTAGSYLEASRLKAKNIKTRVGRAATGVNCSATLVTSCSAGQVPQLARGSPPLLPLYSCPAGQVPQLSRASPPLLLLYSCSAGQVPQLARGSPPLLPLYSCPAGQVPQLSCASPPLLPLYSCSAGQVPQLARGSPPLLPLYSCPAGQVPQLSCVSPPLLPLYSCSAGQVPQLSRADVLEPVRNLEDSHPRFLRAS